jgi:hypothetical protein
VSIEEGLHTAAAVVALNHGLSLEGRVEQLVFAAVDRELVEIAIVELPQIELFIDLLKDCYVSVLGILSLKLWVQFLIFKTPEDIRVLSINILCLNLEIHSIILFSVDIVVSNFKY